MVCPDAYRVSHGQVSSEIHTENWVKDFYNDKKDQIEKYFADKRQAATNKRQAAARAQFDAVELREIMQDEMAGTHEAISALFNALRDVYSKAQEERRRVDVAMDKIQRLCWNTLSTTITN